MGLQAVKNCDFEAYPFPNMDLLSESQIDLLKKNSYAVDYAKGSNIFKQNTLTAHVVFLRTGLLKLYKEAKSGKVLILKLIRDGSFVGNLSFFAENIHQYSVSTLEDSKICFIERAVFRQILRENGNYAFKMLETVSKNGLFIFERLMTQYQKQLPGRIADVLLYFIDEIYESQVFSFPLTRRELAELAGTTKESFIRTLTEFKNDKIIELDGRQVSVKSMEILRTLSHLG